MSRPFYVIAHGINEIDNISNALDKGANAIECDLQHENDRGSVVSHDGISDDDPDLEDYLDSVAALAQINNQLALVVFDCKPSLANHPNLAVPLLSVIRRRLTNRVPLNVLISTGSYANRHFLGALAGRLRVREGVAIDEEDSPHRVAAYFRAQRIQRYAYGNGTFAAGMVVDVWSSILEGIALKARSSGPRMVYVWTLNNKNPIRDSIRMGVDGVFVNHRGALSRGIRSIFEILDEQEFRARVHLARRAFDPFAPPNADSYVLSVETGIRDHAGTDADLGFRLNGENGSLTASINARRPGLFEAGDRNSVTLTGQDIGPLQSLSVWRNTAGNAPGWWLKAITVSSSLLPRSYRFNFNIWIPRRGATRWVAQQSYRFQVKTSDVGYAGTDATARFLLQGQNGSLTHEVDGDVGKRFERDRLNQFTVDGPDLGALQSLTISHDEAGGADDWHIDWVRVRRPGGTNRFEFDRWVHGRPVTSRI